jgi:hypothetical protein
METFALILTIIGAMTLSVGLMKIVEYLEGK